MALKVKVKLNPPGKQKFYTVTGPEEWYGVNWKKIALETPPNTEIRSRLQRTLADLYNKWRAAQRRAAKTQDRSEWPIFPGHPSEIMAEERTRDGMHIFYAHLRNGAIGGGRNQDGWRCPCCEGKPCMRS